MNITAREMKKTSIVLLCLLLSGCSIFKKTTKKEDSKTHKVEQRDVLSSVAENIDITIPSDLFAKLYGLELPKDSVRDSTGVRNSRITNKSKQEPVTISINRTSKTKDKTTVTTEKVEETKTEKTTKKKTTDLIGGFKWFILVGGFVVIIVAWILIKKFV